MLYFPLYNNSKKWHWQEDFGWLGLLLHNHYHSSFNGFQKKKHLSNINNRKILLILCDNDRSTRHLMNCHHATNFWIVSRNDDNKFSPLLFVRTRQVKKMAANFFCQEKIMWTESTFGGHAASDPSDGLGMYPKPGFLGFGFWKCSWEMGLRQVDLGFSSFFAKIWHYLQIGGKKIHEIDLFL